VPTELPLEGDGPETRSSASDPSEPAEPAEAVDPAEPSAKAKVKKKQLPVWQESILLLAVALGLAIVIKAFFIQAF
jgi:signal peptidase I